MVDVKVDGIMLLTGLALLGVAVIYFKFDDIKQGVVEVAKKVDPTNEENIAHGLAVEGINAVTGEDYTNAGQFVYETQPYNPIGWIFEGVGRLRGDIPPGGYDKYYDQGV